MAKNMPVPTATSAVRVPARMSRLFLPAIPLVCGAPGCLFSRLILKVPAARRSVLELPPYHNSILRDPRKWFMAVMTRRLIRYRVARHVPRP